MSFVEPNQSATLSQNPRMNRKDSEEYSGIIYGNSSRVFDLVKEDQCLTKDKPKTGFCFNLPLQTQWDLSFMFDMCTNM